MERSISVGLMNRALRRQLVLTHAAADQFLEALYDTSGPVTAMSELWGSGEFDCGPQDYEYIVAKCLEAVRFYNANRTKPSQV